MAEILFYAGIPLAFALFFVVVVWLAQHAQRRGWSGGSRRIVFYRGPLAIALVLLLAGLALSVHYANRVRQAALDEAQTRFLHEVEVAETDLQSQLSDVGHALYGLRGLFLSSVDVSRAEFQSFIRSKDGGLQFPGVRGLGFIERVPRAGVAALVTRMRATGWPGFAVQSKGTQADLFVIEYLEPESRNATAIGFDIGSESVRRNAAETAMRSGQAAFTKRIWLVQDDTKRPAFLFLLPVYGMAQIPDTPHARERDLRGWAYAPVVFSELIASGRTFDTNALNFQLFDGPELDSDSLVFDSVLPSGQVDAAASLTRFQSSAFSLVRPILIADQVFYLRANSSPAFEASYGRRAHLNAVLLGSGLSVLAAMVLWLLMVGRARAMELADLA